MYNASLGEFSEAAWIAVGILFTLAALILHRIGIHTIAARRGIRRPWLAWLPVGDDYLLGCISDHYQYAVNGRDTRRRRVLMLLVLAILAALLVMVLTFAILLAVSGTGAVAFWTVMSYLIGGWMLFLLMAALVSRQVMRYIALYDLYQSCVSKRRTVYLILSIAFPVAEPIFVFLCRNQDGGMPPGGAATESGIQNIF